MTRYFTRLFLVILVGILAQLLPTRAFGQTDQLSTDRFDLSLSAEHQDPVTPSGGYFSGAAISFSVTVINEGTIAAQDVTISASVPVDGRILSPGWIKTQAGAASYLLTDLSAADTITFPLRYLPASPDAATFRDFSIQIEAASNDSGMADADSTPGKLGKSGPEDDEVKFSLDRYLVLDKTIDTCINVIDSTARIVERFTSLETSITASLPSPIDLSVVGPILISAHKCPVFKVKTPKRTSKKQKQERCSCLRYVFGGDQQPNFPTAYPSDGQRLKGCVEIPSGSQRGDTISIAIRSVDGFPIKRVMLRNGANDILDFQEDVAVFKHTVVLKSDRDTLQLYLQTGRRFFIFPRKQYCFVDVFRRPSSIRLTNGKPPVEGQASFEELSRNLLQSEPDSSWSVISNESREGQTILHRIVETHSTDEGGMIIRDTLSSDTCQAALNIKKEVLSTATAVRISTDTLLFQLKDQSDAIGGQRNVLARRSGSMKVEVPLQLNQLDAPAHDTLIGFAYWIGIGAEPIGLYDTLAEEIPKEWAQPGVSAPLAAFGLNHPVVLPDLGIEEKLFNRNFVTYDFVNERNRSLLSGNRPHRALIPRSAKRPNYGSVTGLALNDLINQAQISRDPSGTRHINFWLSYANKHPVNTYQVRLIVVAYYQVSVPGLEWSSP